MIPRTARTDERSALGPFGTTAPSECREILRAAERELGSFMKAVGNLFGPTAALEAARIWINTVENAYLSTPTGHPNWRDITIRTASQLAEQITDQCSADSMRANSEAI